MLCPFVNIQLLHKINNVNGILQYINYFVLDSKLQTGKATMINIQSQ